MQLFCCVTKSIHKLLHRVTQYFHLAKVVSIDLRVRLRRRRIRGAEAICFEDTIRPSVQRPFVVCMLSVRPLSFSVKTYICDGKI